MSCRCRHAVADEVRDDSSGDIRAEARRVIMCSVAAGRGVDKRQHRIARWRERARFVERALSEWSVGLRWMCVKLTSFRSFTLPLNIARDAPRVTREGRVAGVV